MTKEDALEVLQASYKELFVAYYEGMQTFNGVIKGISPELRTRCESTLLNAFVLERFKRHFPERCNIGRYGRVLFRWDGVTMLVKKLSKKGKPSYIPTILSDGITSQLQMPLFDCEEAKRDAILFFGYTKDKQGRYVDPRIVLFDGDVKWTAYAEDIADVARVPAQADIAEVEVRLKRTERKKAE